jgi:hypothetical protein
MDLANQTVCKRCGQEMEMVANIAPTGAEPGLVAFLCLDCGATESALTYQQRELGRCTVTSMDSTQTGVEFRIMPSGDGCWYWEDITDGGSVVTRGVADDEPTPCHQASEAARKARLIR